MATKVSDSGLSFISSWSVYSDTVYKVEKNFGGDCTFLGFFDGSVLSYVFFVNENFSGGGLSFPNQRKIIKPKANTLIIFPSNWCFPHEVLPVTRGIRYSAVTWGGRIT